MMLNPITDLQKLKALASAYYDQFDVMRYRLQLDDDLDDEAIDRIVQEIAAPIIAAIDCKQCANCCKGLDVQLGDDDLSLLQEGLRLSAEQILSQVEIQDTGDPDIVGILRHKPCPLLSGNLCSVYLHRPTACRDYPYLYPNFRWLLDYLVDDAATCPIIFNVLLAMLDRVDSLQTST